MLTLVAGVIFGFLSACLLITATKDAPGVLNWMSRSSNFYNDPHHHGDIDNEVNN